MSLKRLTLRTVLNLICVLPLLAQDAPAVPGGTSSFAEGPFQPDDQSLQQYRCPDWFRDAKLGIWAVWGPEAVPRQGDWYARHLYEHDGFDDKAGKPTGQSRHNKYHLEHYGHPSKFGFKNIIPQWQAEKWEPDRLMELYKRAGAKYFCMIAMHHDNFDCWNSQFNRWNSVNMGPRRDIAAQWQEAARKQGLRFGMTEHLAASWWFYGVTKGADQTGPLAGVPYDGHDPAYADLYWSGNEAPDFHYYGTNVPTAFKQTWLKRIRDLVDRYHPDLLYSDSPLPYPDEVGRQLLAHYYNDNMQQHGGQLEAIYNCKQDAQGRWIRDLERGVMEGIQPEPWQTDTCVGGWYYDEQVLARHGYKTPAQVIHMLCDIVSKNGNLLLNFPPRPDGTLDDDELKILDAMAAWIAVNGEAIYGTRPWKVYGEGPTKLGKGPHGGLRDTGNYQPSDIRFTQSRDGRMLYAISLGWPDDNQLLVRSLPVAAGKVADVALLGHADKLDWRQTDEGLVVRLPTQRPCDLAQALKISAVDLQPVPVVYDGSLLPGASGRFVLSASVAELHGETPKYEQSGGKDHIGCWAKADDFVSWNIKVLRPGKFHVEVTYSCDARAVGSAFIVEVSGQTLTGQSASTGSWADYRTDHLGTLKFDQPGSFTLAVKPKSEPKWKVIGLKSVVLRPVGQE